MVAVRSRLIAVWFVAMLVVSVLPAVVPTAVAQAADVIVELRMDDNLTIAAANPLPLGTLLRVNVDVRIPAACGTPSLPGDAVDGGTFTLTTAGIIRTAVVTGNLVIAGTRLVASVPFAIEGNQTNGIEGPGKTFAYSIAYAGCTTAPAADTGQSGPGINVDTLAPRVPANPAIIIVNGADSAVASTTIAGISDEVRLSDAADWWVETGSGVSNITVDFRAYGHGTAPIFLGNGARPSGVKFTVNETGTGTPAAPTITGAAATAYTLVVNDTVGNSRAVTPGITVDNVRPAPTTFTATSGDLVLSQRTPLVGGSENNLIKATFASTGADAAAFAQIRASRTVGGVTSEWPIANVSSGAATGATFTIPDDPLTLDDENFLTVLHYFLAPVDAAGNVAPTFSAGGVRPELVFPTLNVHYGLAGNSPSFVSGNALGNIYLNVSGVKTPSDHPHNGPGSLFSSLARVVVDGSLLYYLPGTGTAGNSGSEAHFTAAFNGAPWEDEAPPRDQNAASTIFRPTEQTTTTTLASLPIVMNNLSSFTGHTRSFVDGSYILNTTIVSAGGNSVHGLLRFRVDSQDPVFGNARNYTSPAKGMPVGTSGVVHGGDGNPVRLLISTTDHRTVGTPPALTDSGLRNVTIEFMNADETLLVPHTSIPASVGTLDPLARAVRYNITRDSCSPNPEADALLSTRLLPYCFDLSDWTTSTFTTWCLALPVAQWNSTCFAYDNTTFDASWRGITHPAPWLNQSATFINRTMFSGWVNLSIPDLPAGQYKIRALACDQADRCKKEVFGGSTADFYKVAPTVRLVTNAESPRLTANGGLNVTFYSGQRFAEPVPTEVRDNCIASSPHGVKDICPAARVRVFVSNSDAATGNEGVEYLSFDNADLSGAQAFTDMIGATGAFDPNVRNCEPTTAVPPVAAPGFCVSGGALAIGTHTMTLFPPPPGRVAEPIANSPGGGVIRTTDPVFVRVVAETADGLVKNSTGWIRATASNAASARVNEPTIDWALNRSSDPRGPMFNVSFDAKELSAKPKLTLLLYNVSDGPNHDRDRLMNVTPGADPATSTTAALVRNMTAFAGTTVFNAVESYWTGRIEVASGNLATACAGSAAACLPVGDYRLDALVYDNASGALRGIVSRLFSVVDPGGLDVVVSPTDLANAFGVSQRGSTYYVARQFEIPFTIVHGSANVTAGDLAFKIRRDAPRPGQPTEIEAGTSGFVVNVPFPTFDEGATSTQLVANVTLPDGIVNRDSFRLNITAKVDEAPFHFGNITRLIPLQFDQAPPTATLQLPETQSSVVNFNTNNPRLNKDPVAPRFDGFTEDLGSGVKKLEVRIYDLTANVMVRPDTVVNGYQPNEWAVATDASGARLKLHPEISGIRLWTYDVSHLVTAGLIALHHNYTVDVRATDALGAISSISTTTNVTFDPVVPFLGYSTRLDSTNARRSGIDSGGITTVDWHGSRALTVSVTDNLCIKAVRLVGKSDLHPTTILRANMTALGTPNAQGLVCYTDRAAMPASVGGVFYAQYRIDLRDAPRFTDEITNYTYWFEAEDAFGNAAEVPTGFQNFRMQVLDNTPAIVRSVTLDPSPGQAGGRTLVRADVFDNLAVSHVTIQFRDAQSHVLIANGTLRAPEGVANGVGNWTADTEEDLNLTLETRDYLVNVTAYDINWNRAISPTCPAGFCLGSSMIYRVRDDGAPSVSLVSPIDGSTVNATPVFKIRALNKNLVQADVTVRAGVGENLTAIPAASLNFTELKSTNGTRQGWDVLYSPGTLEDAANFTLNVTANVGGLQAARNFSFRVDTLPPNVSANVTDAQPLAGKDWVVAATRVTLVANDTVAATPTIRYSVNGGAEETYAGPITPSGNDGEWKLEYWATDAAQNTAARQTLRLNVDKTGPRISVSQHGDTVLLTATDTGVGLNESSVTVHYRYGEAIAFTPKLAEKDTGNIFRAVLPGNATESGLSYYLSAIDSLGNVGSATDATGRTLTAAAPYVIAKAGENGTQPPSNLPPTVQITSPTAGSSVREFLDLRWLAEDPESEPLSITIALREPAPDGEVVSAGGENSGSFRLNLSGKPAGAYTIVITASDGENSGTDLVLFNIETGETIKPISIPPPTVRANQPVSVAVAIEPTGKTVDTATYRVIKDGQLYRAGNMTPTAGRYAATFVPTESGAYRILLDVGYSDGSRDTAKQIATFTVPGGTDGASAKVFPGSLIAILALAGVTAALAAYGAFGRWRK